MYVLKEVFTEGEEEVGASLPGFFLSLPDLISHSIPLWGGLNEEVRRADVFCLLLPEGRGSSSMDQGMNSGRRKE